MKRDEFRKEHEEKVKGKKRITMILYPNGNGGYINKTGSNWIIDGVAYPSE